MMNIQTQLHPRTYKEARDNKEARDKRIAKQDAREELATKRMQKSLHNKTMQMLNSFCAVNNMNKCSATCVHFKCGYIHTHVFLDGYCASIVTEPRCKLWKG